MDLITLDAASPTWPQLLSGLPHDFYHLPGYAAFAAAHQDGGTPMAIGARDGDAVLLVPLLVRPVEVPGVEAGWRDATSPRGYPGPLLSPSAEQRGADFLLPAVGVLRAGLRDNGVVAAYVRLHPFLGVT